MADDMMLINFDPTEIVSRSKPRIQDGRRKDQRGHRALRQRRESASDDQREDVRQAKRQRIEQSDGRGAPSASAREQPQYVPKGADQAKRPSGQVISSLFTSNPRVSTTDTEVVENDTNNADPSNAPLKDELATFTSLGLSKQLAEYALEKLGIRAPTAIQKEAISLLCRENTDAFIQAETGSGKTLAYLLPIVQRIMALPHSKHQLHRGSGLFAIILAPTRELSKQISIVLENLLASSRWIVSGAVMGGEKKKSEKARLRKGLNILIATPGRLADHLEHTEVLDVNNVRWLVLDEGDRLMELGFERDIEKILTKLDQNRVRTAKLSSLPPKRTTILCSATLKMSVQKLGELSLKNAVHIQAARSQLDNVSNRPNNRFSAPIQLQQSYVLVPAKLRLVSLAALLKRTFDRRGSVMKAVVFMSCSDSVDFHFDIFARQSEHANGNQKQGTVQRRVNDDTNSHTSVEDACFSVKDSPVGLFRLHGSHTQAVRTSTLSSFRASKKPAVMMCTDVASRGLDLPDIDFVIEYDPPFSQEDHLHRIGRTARAGKNGRALLFLMPGTEEGYVQILEQSRQDGGHHLTRSVAESLLRKGFGSPGLGAGEDWDQRATEWQLDVERWILDNPARLEEARRAFQSHVRAYATHVASERQFFDLTTLHLGHLAKAFGLRDKPGDIRIPGRRPTSHDALTIRNDRQAAAKAQTSKGQIHGTEPDALSESRRKMRSKAKEQANQVSEFNIG